MKKDDSALPRNFNIKSGNWQLIAVFRQEPKAPGWNVKMMQKFASKISLILQPEKVLSEAKSRLYVGINLGEMKSV